MNRPKYASLWQQTLFCLCTITKKSKAVTALQQEDVAVLTQDQKAKPECFQQIQNCTCSAVKPWLEGKVISAQLQGPRRKAKCILHSVKYFPALGHPELGSLYIVIFHLYKAIIKIASSNLEPDIVLLTVSFLHDIPRILSSFLMLY